TNLWTIFFNLIAVVGMATVLTGPVLLFVNPSYQRALAYGLGIFIDPAFIRIGAAVFMTNLLDALCLFVLVVVMTTLLAHRLMWPLIKRPIYAANRKQLIKNTKLLGALGAVLLRFAFPRNLDGLLDGLMELFSKLKRGG